MNKFISLILVIAGIYLCYVGNSRRNSVVGGIDTAAASVADTVAGEGHTTDATWYFVGGGALIVVGAIGLTRRARL